MKMKLSYWIKSLVLFLILLSFGSLIIVKAQRQSNLQKLEGTKWIGETSFILSGGLQSDTEYRYSFLNNNKVEVAFISQVGGWSWVTEYNTSTAKWENVYKFTVQSTKAGNESGAYKQNGNSIHIEFPNSHQIEGQLNNNRMTGKLTSRTGEKVIWTAIIVSEQSEIKTTSKSEKNDTETKNSEGAALADNLDDLDNPQLYLRTYEAQATGTFKISDFSGEQRGLMRLEIDIKNMDNLKARFTFNSLSGELSGKIYDNKKLQLSGLGILKGNISETKYQCSINALIKNGTLTEGKYYCKSGNDVINGTFETALIKNN